MTKTLQTWHFEMNNDQWVELVLSGKKTAVTSLYNGNDISHVEEEAILIFDNEKKACLTKTKKVIITEFKNINEDLSNLEGIGTLTEWKKAYTHYFKTRCSNFTEDTKVVFKIFEVKENLVKQRLELAEKIVRANKDIIGDKKSIEEINAGFNNSLFSVNDQYILKVCGESEKEASFDVEVNFYHRNQDNKNIPTLYKYDNSKGVGPYVYEILEKVDGKSVYYHWYKMSEQQREEWVKELVDVLRKMHSNEGVKYDWSAAIKASILSSFNKTTNLFSEDESYVIMNSLDQYDEILSDNTFCCIHNDLHFDNILLDSSQKIKLIDFNDSITAPFDFDLRLLYMSVFFPWKWANIEMDSFQKTEDYQNLFHYIKKYYTKLNAVKYLEERMIIYWILYDFELLSKFRNNEEKERILMNCKKILNTIIIER
ncbi:MAG: phosphotransferase [Beduini sp.]|uniref:phosphotransferase n=1 Tax=Beduini sp. TaxID=1922300 RepID=UPI0039A3DAB2